MGVIGAVASSIGADEAALRLMLSLMFGECPIVMEWGRQVYHYFQLASYMVNG